MAKCQFVSWNIILVFPFYNFGISFDNFGITFNNFGISVNNFGISFNNFGISFDNFGVIFYNFGISFNYFVFPFIILQTEAGRPFWYFLERRRLLFLSKQPTKMSYQRLTKGAIYV